MAALAVVAIAAIVGAIATVGSVEIPIGVPGVELGSGELVVVFALI